MFLHFSALELPSFLGRSVISREFERLICDIRCRTSLWNGGHLLRVSVLGSRLIPVFVRLEELFSKRSILISHWRAIFFPNHRLASAIGALDGNTIRE